MQRKVSHLEASAKQDYLCEKIVNQESYNKKDNLLFRGIQESKGENLQVMTNLSRDVGVACTGSIWVVGRYHIVGSHI